MPHPKQCQFLGETRGKEKVAGHRARTGESGTKVGLEDIGMKDAWNTEMLRIDLPSWNCSVIRPCDSGTAAHLVRWPKGWACEPGLNGRGLPLLCHRKVILQEMQVAQFDQPKLGFSTWRLGERRPLLTFEGAELE